MNCDALRNVIHDYVDGNLANADSELVRTHLDECARCAHEVRDLRGVTALLDQMEVEPAPVGFADHVIAQLKTSGLIAEPVRGGLFDGLQNRWRIALAGVLVVLLAAVVFPATVGLLEGVVGKGTVLVADTYLEVQDKAADVAVFTRLIESLEHNLGTLKTVATAGFSLLARAGEVFFLPALLTMLLLGLGVLFFLRASHRRSAEHAIYSL